ncbi:MAG: hypothetical protein CL708_04590 [Chloroflexi bacterium]|nr:hypothetical protein [Chloroflexota bacterium]
MGRLNKIMLIGNAGNDAELRYTPSGDSVASFSMAVNENYTNREGQQIDQTQWFRISVWGRRSEFVGNNIKKGMQVYAEGRIKSNLYQDNSGETKVSLEVNAYDIQIVQDPQSQQSDNQSNFPQPGAGTYEQPAAQPRPTAQPEPTVESGPATQPESPAQPESGKKDDELPW